MSEHTPGPWNIDGGTNKKGNLYIWKKGEYYGGHAIATVHSDIQEGAEGNAHLIAAAPELLEACKEAKAYILRLEREGKVNNPEVFHTLRAAIITAATG